MSGSATLTITASRVTMKNPSSAAAGDHAESQFAREVSASVAAWVTALTATRQPVFPPPREVPLCLVMTEPPSPAGPDVR